jgi:hypothetical protein
MRIVEILYPENEPPEENDSDPQLNLPQPSPFRLLATLADLYVKDRLVQRFRDWKGSGSQPGPASPDAETHFDTTARPRVRCGFDAARGI